MEILGIIVIVAAVLFIIGLLAANIVIVPQASAFIVERLGAYQATWETGLHFKIPLIEKVANRVTLKERAVSYTHLWLTSELYSFLISLYLLLC